MTLPILYGAVKSADSHAIMPKPVKSGDYFRSNGCMQTTVHSIQDLAYELMHTSINTQRPTRKMVVKNYILKSLKCLVKGQTVLCSTDFTLLKFVAVVLRYLDLWRFGYDMQGLPGPVGYA